MLAILPARGGSKGVPRKNIRMLAGQPLISYAIVAAKAARCIERVIVTTEDDEIAAIAREWGAEVPFMRPAELATDTAPASAACLHVIDELVLRGETHNNFMMLQATSAFTTPEDIEEAVEVFESSNADAVCMVEAFEYPIESVFQLTEDNRLENVLRARYGANFEPSQRQSFGKRYAISGGIVIYRTEMLRADCRYLHRSSNVVPLIATAEHCFDIDTPFEFEVADLLMQRRKNQIAKLEETR